MKTFEAYLLPPAAVNAITAKNGELKQQFAKLGRKISLCSANEGTVIPKAVVDAMLRDPYWEKYHDLINTGIKVCQLITAHCEYVPTP